MDPSRVATPSDALALHGLLPEAPFRLVEPGGLINTTWLVGTPPSHVLQKVNAIFPPGVHHRIYAVTEHVAERGLVTPRIVPARDGRLVIPAPDGWCWRLMDFVPGRTVHRVEHPAMAREAACLVGRFHAAMLDFTGDLSPLRPNPHDTLRHVAALEEAVDVCGDHRLADGIRQVGRTILGGWDRWLARVGLRELPVRPAHGDLKISNLRFDAGGRAVCLIDLDTLSSMPLALELGDAMRSWCDRGGEDSGLVDVDLGIFAAAMGGYADSAVFATPAELASVPAGTWRICLELAARFATDAFHECYFGWDPQVAKGRGEHNLLRARGQLALAQAVERRLGEMQAIVS